MADQIVRLKVVLRNHGMTKAVLYPQIKVGQLCDYNLETGEYDLTIIVEDVIKQ